MNLEKKGRIEIGMF